MAVKGLRRDGPLRAVESDAQMESSFRRLLAAVEAEREDIRSSLQSLEEERDSTEGELRQIKHDTEEWCTSEKGKIDAQWKKLDTLSEKMADFWPKRPDIVKINCCGHRYELPRTTLQLVEGSHLSELFSDDNPQTLEIDAEGFLYFDMNPHCFALVVEYLQNRRLRVDAPLPVVPRDQLQSMEMIAEKWNLTPFLRENRVNHVHTTSLRIMGNTIEATHPGWQVVSSMHPLPLSAPCAFEVTVLSNPGAGSSGGMAIGICGHSPAGSEIHSVLLPDSVMYTSGNGLIGDACAREEVDNVSRDARLEQGTRFGVRHDPATHSLQWFHNGQSIGSSAIREEMLAERMRYLYPTFALYVAGQVVDVKFRAAIRGAAGVAALADGAG